MGAILKYKISPTVFGVVSCVCLIFSWALSRILQQLDANAAIDTVSPQLVRRIEVSNYLLVFFSLCLCVHFVRGTAQLFDKHVWEMPSIIVLICIPVFNLAVTLWSLIAPESVFLNNCFVAALLIVFSMPAFFCYYFIYIFRHFRGSALFRIAAVLLFAVGGLYLLFRFCDNVVFPLISERTAFEVLPAVKNIVSFSARLSVVVYLLAIFCFTVFGKLLFDAALAQVGQAGNKTEESG